ncbi:copper resistance protein CopC [Curtobacterium sp. MCJR17_055]|uniref:copper resistance CopC family protein n=1 Tax=unclassified Curtobacterium TaxID=257496 RepID=UPI000D977EED|nr:MULTISPECIES: copper resistance CopC family protein [unclassified Curtobacterium]PYY32176.1 copper resistance protein CopC [Curtobacterium sp. MCBD17_029]PYY53908.1 copper resistance protein CopC [Curtobacterium sp. MCJR17_055]PYY59204.1 copper resistance protein CopC [Curtobacterium sp. MCPF17_015]WIB34850.1 copper resistance protein CopC [Curtobacterium sp. MCJR17_043]
MPRTGPSSSSSRRVGGSALALAVVLAAVVAGPEAAAPASAHSALIGSTPADGATVTTAVRQVDLTFSEAPLAGLNAGLRIEVRDQTGQDESTGEVRVEGTTMSKRVDLSAGPHTVLWRYVSPDGHPVDGQVAFTVEVAPTPSSAPTPVSAPSATASREARLDTSATATPTPADAADPTATSTGAPVLPWALGGVLLVVAGVVVLAVRRRSSRAGG